MPSEAAAALSLSLAVRTFLTPPRLISAASQPRRSDRLWFTAAASSGCRHDDVVGTVCSLYFAVPRTGCIMKRAAVTAVGRIAYGRRTERPGVALLTTLAPLSACSTILQPCAHFSAYNRPRRHRRTSPKPPRTPPTPPSPPPPPAAPARPRPKHAAPYPVTLDQMRAYQKQQSFFSRLSVLRNRLHHTFQLIRATQHSSEGRVSAAVRTALNYTTNVFRSFAPFESPFPSKLYHHFLTLHALTTPASAHQLLIHGRRLKLVGEDSELAVMEAYGRGGNSGKVRELMNEARDRGERVTVRMYEALLDSAKDDVKQLTQVREEMSQDGVKLSDKCWLLMLPAYSTDQSATDGLRRLLSDVSVEQSAVSADLAHAIVKAFSQTDHRAVLQSTGGTAALNTFVLAQMEYNISHPTACSPEHSHHLLLSTPSLHGNSRAWSMVLRAYARREYVHTSHIALYDMLVIRHILKDMAARGVAEDEYALQARMMLAAQRGEGDNVLAMMKQSVETFQPPASLFLPVLRTIVALTDPLRLPVLLSLHSYLHSRRLSSHFSFSIVLSLQSTMGDVAGIATTLKQMKESSIPLTMHHWHQLLLSSPNSTQVMLLRDMMAKLHVLPSAYADAIVLSKQTTLRDAEQYYASLLTTPCPTVSPHPIVRLAMADIYGALGMVRWACRQWWKVVSGSAEKVTKAEDESREAWTVMGEVSEEEMDRMLRQMSAASVGNRSDAYKLRSRLKEVQRLRQKDEEAGRRYYRKLLNLPVKLNSGQKRSEALRTAAQEEYVRTTPLLTQRMQAQMLRMEADVDDELMDMVGTRLVKQFGDMMRHYKARVPYVHMELLEHKSAEDEAAEDEAAAQYDEQQGDWMREEEEKLKAGEGTVLIDLDEDINKKKSQQQAQTRTTSEQDIRKDRRVAENNARTASEESAARSVFEDEDLAMMEAARQLVASRRPKQTL